MTRTAQTLAIVAGLMLVPAAAQAGGFGFNLDIGGRKSHVGVGVHVGDHVGVGVHVARPHLVAVTRQVYVPPEYAVVSERVWVPTTETVIRDVPVYDAMGRIVAYRQEPEVVHGGYWTTVQKQVLIRDGYYRRTVTGDIHRRHPAVSVGAQRSVVRRAW